MNKFYLDIDILKNKYYVTPSPQKKGEAFVIEFDNRYLAEIHLKELLLEKIKSPGQESSAYNLHSVVKNALGELKIYKTKA
jgi:hypothetical protein